MFTPAPLSYPIRALAVTFTVAARITEKLGPEPSWDATFQLYTLLLTVLGTTGKV